MIGKPQNSKVLKKNLELLNQKVLGLDVPDLRRIKTNPCELDVSLGCYGLEGLPNSVNVRLFFRVKISQTSLD